jgi:membrane protein implicated in regulation of membrane protease activity
VGGALAPRRTRRRDDSPGTPVSGSGGANVFRAVDERRIVGWMSGNLVGKMGRVSDVVPAGGAKRGEVMVDGQAYYALPVDLDDPIPTGTRIVVVEYFPPRTVVVTRL